MKQLEDKSKTMKLETSNLPKHEARFRQSLKICYCFLGFLVARKSVISTDNRHFTCHHDSVRSNLQHLSVYVALYLTAEKPNLNILDCSIFAKET